jgi:uncharacterized phiE125 gp8 family phage protein
MKWNDIYKERELVSVTSPNNPIVDMVQLRKHCTIPDDLDYYDTILSTLAGSAEKLIEGICEVTLREKVFNLNLASWPNFCDYMILRLENPPVKTITHIKYYDGSDVQQTMATSDYDLWLQKNPPSILIRADRVPTISYERSKPVEIRYTAGYASSIPEPAKLLVMELVAFWFQNREFEGRIPLEGGQGRVSNMLISSLKWRLL